MAAWRPRGRRLRLRARLPLDSEDGPNGFGLTLSAPSLTRDLAALALTVDAPQQAAAALLDALARRLAVRTSGTVAGTTRLEVPTAGLAQGVYLVRVAPASGTATRRLSVAR